MADKQRSGDMRIGRYLELVREEAGITQAELAKNVTFSTATISRIESGDKSASREEILSMLKAIGTEKAIQLRDHLERKWNEIDRPEFDHPNIESLWKANQALTKLRRLRKDPKLKAVFLRQIDLYEAEIRRLVDFLQSREHPVAYLGTIGVGKSTAICKQTDLWIDSAKKLDKQCVLEIGPGRTTLCEVHISQGAKYGLRIVPRSENSIRKDVEEFCEYLIRCSRDDNSDVLPSEEGEKNPLGVAQETVRAIRCMAGLANKKEKGTGGKWVIHDPALELAKKYTTAKELTIQVLNRMELFRRNRLDIWYPDNSQESPKEWIQRLFAEVNNGRHQEFTLPKQIEVVIPGLVLNSREYPLRIIDTKGIDQTAERQDLECHFDNPRTLIVLCSSFRDAPQTDLQRLLERAREAGVRDILSKTVLLVLPHNEQALEVKYNDGSKVDSQEEGYDEKRSQIHLALDQKGFGDLTVEFFNAKEESPVPIQNRLVAKIEEIRNQYCEQITQLFNAVSQLDENRENEELRLVFEHVSSDLNSWVQRNHIFDVDDEGVQQPLIDAINGTRYASTIRAAVLRYGEWDNLDYYHHLARGVRLLAVKQFGRKLKEFRVIVENLAGNDELASAKKFLERLIVRLDSVVDEAYRKIQSGGRAAFKQAMEKDHALWNECEGFWGKTKVRGKTFRLSVAETTDERISTSYDDAHKFLLNLLSDNWKGVIRELEEMVQEKKNIAVH